MDAWLSSPSDAVKALPVIVGATSPWKPGVFVELVMLFPVAVTGADPLTVSVPKEEVVPIPERVTFESPVIAEVPSETVTACGAASIVIGKVPTKISNSGSEAATTVMPASPEIAKEPIAEVAPTPVTKIDVPGVVTFDAILNPEIVGATSP